MKPQVPWYHLLAQQRNFPGFAPADPLHLLQMTPEVFFTVCYGHSTPDPAIAALHTFRPAVLHDYCRQRVVHADYPGITAEPGKQVFGSYVTGLTRANVGRLDVFEGDQYERRRLRVRLLTRVGADAATGKGREEGEEVEAQTYVFVDRTELEDREWDLEEFRREKLRFWTRAGYVFAGESTIP